MKSFSLFQWILGFLILITVDLFAEAFVFDWLNWNETNKNDWFFILWWAIVFVWLLYGINKFSKKIF
jgi:hypothetical protein